MPPTRVGGPECQICPGRALQAPAMYTACLFTYLVYIPYIHAAAARTKGSRTAPGGPPPLPGRAGAGVRSCVRRVGSCSIGVWSPKNAKLSEPTSRAGGPIYSLPRPPPKNMLACSRLPGAEAIHLNKGRRLPPHGCKSRHCTCFPRHCVCTTTLAFGLCIGVAGACFLVCACVCMYVCMCVGRPSYDNRFLRALRHDSWYEGGSLAFQDKPWPRPSCNALGLTDSKPGSSSSRQESHQRISVYKLGGCGCLVVPQQILHAHSWLSRRRTRVVRTLSGET